MILFLGLLIDRVVGDPDWLWKRVPHPVVLFGTVISALDRRRGRGKFASFCWGLALLAAFAAMSTVIHVAILALGAPGLLLELAIVVVLLAQKSLADHVVAVRTGLRDGGLQGGRRAVSMIVGRDVQALDESGIAGAAIESLAENASDGVVAPAMWYALAGVGGIVFYKAVNTADSMIGHRGEPFEWYGKPAARLDDAMNWPAARLTALLVVLVLLVRRGSSAAIGAWRTIRRDAPGHRSPNAGWPETAFAVSLGVALGGPRRYSHGVVEGAWMNADGERDINPALLSAALRIFRSLCNALLGVALIWILLGSLI